MKRPLILVTGGAGYIGRVLVQKLVDYGANVRVVDTFYFPSPPLFPTKNIECIWGDIQDVTAHHEWFDGVDGVCHLAGFSNDPTADADPVRNGVVNAVGTKNVGAMVKAKGIKRFTYASSASIYDMPSGPHTQTPVLCTENDVVHPVGHYSVSKYDGERYLLSRGVDAVIFRQATVFGDSPRMRFDLVVNTMTRAALSSGEILVHGGGQNHRPLISVDNVAMCHVHEMLNRHPRKGGIYNLVDFNMSVYEIAKEVQTGVELVTGKSPKVKQVPYPEGVRIRDYQISGAKFGPPGLATSLRYHVQNIATQWKDRDMFKPEYENIKWMERLHA